MIKGEEKKVKKILSKSSVLEEVDDYNIYSYYLGREIDFKKKYNSPLREGKQDNTPNLSFFPNSNGKILFKDFATGVGGDCFTFVQKMFNLTFFQALQKIDKDFGLGLDMNNENQSVFKIQLIKKPDSIHKQTKLIQIISREFTEEEILYWRDYYISKSDLILHDIYGIDKLYINKRLIPRHNAEIRFAYKFDDYLKIYSPYSQDYKWISSVPNDFMSGFDNIKHKVFTGTQDEKLIISKSLKDELILKKFFKDVCSTQNESSASINDENMKVILKGYKPENIYISYDNDQAGIEAANYYVTNYGFQTLFTPNIYFHRSSRFVKDWGELVKQNGLFVLENYFKVKKLI